MDIREHLNALPLKKLKDLARRHNALYRIKIGGGKSALVEALAKQYEKMTGTHLIPRPLHELSITKEPRKKLVITKKSKPIDPLAALEAKLEADEKRRAAEQAQKLQLANIKAKARTALAEQAQKLQLANIKAKARTALAEQAQKLQAQKLQSKAAKEQEAPQKLSYKDLTPAQKKQADALLKKRAIRRKESEAMQKAMAADLAIPEPQPPPQDSTAADNAIIMLAKMRGITPAEMAREMGVEPPVKQEPEKVKKAREKLEKLKELYKKRKNEIEGEKLAEQMNKLTGIIDDYEEQEQEQSVIQKIHNTPEAEEPYPHFSFNKQAVLNPTQEQLKLMAGNQANFDFYQTPQDALDTIKADLHMMGLNRLFEGLNALEPSAGMGALLSLLVEEQPVLKLKNLDAIEYDAKMKDILNDNFKISHIYRDNFFLFKQERPYDLIIMNPPYEGWVGDDESGERSKVAYLYHIAKAILLKSSSKSGYAKTIFAIVPGLRGMHEDGSQMDFDEVLTEADKKRMKKIFKISIDDFPRAIITKIGTTDKFEKIVYSRGKFNKKPLGLKVDIYRIQVY